MQQPSTILMLNLLRSRQNYLSLGPVLTKEYFLGDEEPVHWAITQYWNRDKKEGPDVADIESLRVIASAKCDERRMALVDTILNRMENAGVPQPPAVVHAVREFIVRQGVANLVSDLAMDLDRNKAPNLEGLSRKISRLTTTRDGLDTLGEDYLGYNRAYVENLVQNRVPSGIRRIDESIGGGLGPKEFGIIIAPFGGGKTATIVNFGAQALLLGKRVLHLTMEIHTPMVVMRYDMRLGGLTTPEILRDHSLVGNARKRVKDAGGSLVIVDKSHEDLTILGLERLIEATSKEAPIDLVLVDYADLLRSDRMLEGRRFELGEIYRNLRRVASEYEVPIWTASQATREASKTGEFQAADVAEDISKMHTCDVALCLIQTERQRMAGQMSLKIGKTRMSADRIEVPVSMDYMTMTMKEMEHSEDVVDKLKRRLKYEED